MNTKTKIRVILTPILIVLLVMLSILLGACQPKDVPATATPTTEAPAATEAPVATQQPVAVTRGVISIVSVSPDVVPAGSDVKIVFSFVPADNTNIEDYEYYMVGLDKTTVLVDNIVPMTEFDVKTSNIVGDNTEVGYLVAMHKTDGSKTAELELVREDTIAPIASEATSGYDYAGLPSCDNPDEDRPINGEGGVTLNADGLWEINIHNNGCNLVFEGLRVKGQRVHDIVVLRSAEGENSTLVENGIFTYSEGSIWQKPRDKNMQDVTNMQDPPESMKLVNDHRANMLATNYDWPIDVYSIDGVVQTFALGETWEGMPVVDNCGFSEPIKIPVHGEKIPGKNQFSAAIGAEGCITVAWIDGSETPEQWSGPRDAATKVTYVTIFAWLMPSSWSQSEIDAWIITP